MQNLIIFQENRLPSQSEMTGLWVNSGIFPANLSTWQRWATETAAALQSCTIYIDMFPLPWPSHVNVQHFNAKALQIQWRSLVSFWNFDHSNGEVPDFGLSNSWVHELAGKTVLYIGALPISVRKQFDRPDSRTPRFKELKIIPTAQAYAGNTPAGYEGKTVFDALEDLYRAIDRIGEFDIALISAGASAPLLAHYVFKTGRTAIYFGGSLQGLFGIKGTRWLHELHQFLAKHPEEQSWWVSPDPSERPPHCERVENCPYFLN